MNVLGLSGSLRERSSNGAVLRTAAAEAPHGTRMSFFEAQLADVPAFSPDLDGEGATPPRAVADLRAQLAAANAVLVASPEYAHGVPGALKNALDWIVSSGEFTDKPVALLVAPSGAGTFALASLRETLTVMGARVVSAETLRFVRAGIDEQGLVIDPTARGRIAAVMAALRAAAA